MWLAIIGRNSGVRCSDILGIDGPAAIDLDLCCAVKLTEHDDKRELDRLKAHEIIYTNSLRRVLSEWSGGPAPDDDETD